MANDFMSRYIKPGSRKSRPVGTNSNSWISNAIKSVGYSAFDVLTELMPATADVAKSTATIGTDIAMSIQKTRTTDRTLKTAIQRNFYAGLGKDILKNSLEDLKSGKFYNKDRTDKYFADMNEDFDMGDVDFGDENFDMDEFDDSIDSADGMAHASFNRKKGGNNEVTNIVVGTNLGPDSAIVKATEFQTETSVNVGRAIIENSKVDTRAMMTMVGGFRNEINTSLSAISDNISTMTGTISESLGKHMTLSAKYYEDSISLQTQILEHLRTQATSAATNTKQFKEYNNILDIMTSGGALDFNAYKALVKKQAGNYVDNNMFLSQLKFMNENRDSLQMMALSPFQKVLENTVKSIIPKTMQSAMTAFDEQLKETTIGALNQISGLQRSNNPILSAIGQIFGVQNKLTISKIDKSAYNKGAMAWSGTDHQALTNVIPTLLRKIYASVSGTQEIGFDYNQGIFRNVKDMEDEAAKDKLRRETGGYADYKSGFKEFLNKNFAASGEEKTKYSDDFEKFISKLVRDSYGGRTFRKGGRTGNQKNANGQQLDDIRDLLGANSSDDKNVQVIRAYFQYLERTDKAALTRFFGNGLQEQRASLDRQNREIQNDPIKYNTMYTDTGLTGAHKTDSHLKFGDQNDKSRVTGINSGVAAGTIDKYGRNSNYYLREILSTLTTGIYVVPIGSLLGDTSDNSDVLSSIKGRRDNSITSLRNDRDKAKRNERATRLRPSNYSDERRNKDVQNGKFDINGDIDTEVVAMRAASEDTSQANAEDKSFIGKIMGKIPEDSGLGKILGRIRKSSNKMGEKGTGIFNTLNNALFDVVFGDGEGRKGASAIFSKAMGVLKSGFASFATFLDNKIFKPLDNALFGEDGFVNKLKQSEFGQKISEMFNNVKTKASSFFLGELDSEGNRSGGLFSETANSLKDIGTQVKNGILGEKGPDGKPLPLEDDNSVLGNLKRMFKSTSDSIGNALGIEKSDETLGTRLNNTINLAFNRISERATEWSNNIFGRKDENGEELNSVFNSEFASQFKEDMKGQKGFIGATASIGLLSSFFLPGGPIGGALVGAGVGIISKSRGLKNLLFGPEDDNGDRIGGLVNKEVQDFFKDNKTGIAVGAIGGMASSIGLLPSFFLPGGPIGGALVGAGVSLIAKSDAFNTLLYGEGGTKDDPTGGLMANIKKAFGKNKDLKGIGLDAGIGAGVGILGSFFLPGGPLIHAILGSALSVGTATDKFKNWFFGEEGTDGKRTGGMFSKFSDYMKEKIFSPLSKSVKIAQSHIMEFVEENMMFPFKYAIDPLVKEATHAKEIIGKKISNVFDSFKTALNDRVVDPIGKTVDKYLISPIKNTLKKLFSGLGTLIGGIISSPFKLIGAMGWGAYEKQKKRGKEEYINSKYHENDNTFFGKLSGKVKRFGMRVGLIDKEGVDAAQYSENGASYEANQEVERLKRYETEIAENRVKRENEREAIRNGVKPETKVNTTSDSNKENQSPKNNTKVDTTNAEVSVPDIETSPSKRNKKSKKKPRGENRRARKRNRNKSHSTSINSNVSEPTDINDTMVSDLEAPSDTRINTTVDTEPTISDSKYKPETPKVNTNLDSGSTKVNTDSFATPKADKVSGGKIKDTGSAVQAIQKDVSKISDSVYGQLNGVGSNVNKIYRLLLKKFGKKDEDIKGDNNKDYVGFFGKIRTALNNPFKAIKDVISAPFKKISEAGHSLATKIKGIGTGIANAGKSLLKGLGSVVKGVGQVGLELLKLPIDLVKTGLSAVRAALPAIGEAVKAGVSVIGTGLQVAGSMLVTGVETVGNTIASAASGLGQLIGGAMSGLGSILSAFGLIGKDVLKGIWGGMKFIGKEAFELGKSIISAPINLIGSIAERIGGRGKKGGFFGKGPVHVIVDSGILDRVKIVDLVKKVSSNEGNTTIPEVTQSVVSASTRLNTEPSLPLNLQFFGNKKSDDTSVDNNSKGESKVNPISDAIDVAKDKFKSAGNAIRNKLKRKDDKERSDQVERGSRSSLLGRLNAADAKEEESKFKTKLLSLLQRSADSGEEHKTSFMKVFDIKKGLITAGIIALAPFIIKLFKKFDIGALLTSLLDSITTGFSEIGGIPGLINNVEEKVTQVSDVVNKKDTHYKVDENGNLVYGENGKPEKESTDSSRISALLTPTKTRINTETGKWENNKTWTGTSDSIVNYAGHKAIKVAKGVTKVYKTGKKVVGGVKTVASGAKKIGKKTIDFATSKSDTLKTVYTHADDAVKTVKGKVAGTATKVAKNVKTAGKKAVTTSFDAVKGKVAGTATKVAKSDGIIAKAIKMMQKALTFLVTKFAALGKRFGVKIGESALGAVLKSVKTIFNPSKLKGLATKISKFVAKITSKTATSSSTLFLAEIGFALYGAIDGACNAGALFEVNPKDVDAKMRAIAGVFKSLLNTSIGSWVDLINSLVYDLLGFNFVKTIASHVYKLLSSDEGDANLEEAQKRFTEEYEQTVEQEYAAYVESTQAQGETPMSFEDFKASGLSTTRSEYNSKVNKSLAKRVVDGVQGAGKAIKKAGNTIVGGVKKAGSAIANSKFGKTVSGAAKKVGSTVVGGVKTAGKKIKKIGSNIVNGAKEKLGGLVDKGKEIFGNVGESITKIATQGADAAKGLAKGFLNIKNAFENKDNSFLDYFKSDVNPLGDDNAFHGVVGGILNISKVVMFPKLLMFGIFKKVAKAITGTVKKVFDGAKNAVGDYTKNVANIGKLAISGNVEGLKSYEITTSDDNPIGGIVSGMAGISRILHYPIAYVSMAGQTVVKTVKKVFNGAKNAVGDYIKNAANIGKLAISGNVEGLKSYEIKTSEDNPIGGIVSGIVGISRILHYPIAYISMAGKKIVSTVKGAIGVVGDTGATIVSGAKEIGSLAISGDVEGLKSYTGVDEEGNPIAPFANAVLGASKLVFTPIAMVTSVGKKAANFVKTSIGKVTDLGTKVKDFIGKLNKYTDPDKSLSGWDKETIDNSTDPVTNIISSLVKKVMWVYVGIVRSIKGAFDWVTDTAANIKDTVVDTATNAKDTVVGGVKKAGNAVANAADKVGTWVMNFGRGGDDGGRPIGGKGETPNELNGTPYYSQNDPKYKNKPYKERGKRVSSKDTMGESGCGPTAMAMVASKVTGKKYDPMTMAKLAEAGGYNTSVGTTPGYFGATANRLGIENRRYAPTANNLAGSLANGESVILQGVKSGKVNSPYTSEGHYVTATGINKDNVIINDPRGRQYSGAYKLSDVLNDTVGMWSFGGGSELSPSNSISGGASSLPNSLSGGAKSSSNKTKFYRKKGIVGGFGANADIEKWLNIVREVKKAIAAQKPGYSQSRFIKITVGGKTLSVRTDCSGYVGACLKYFGVLGEKTNVTSRTITDQNNGTMKKTGFTPGGWPGWDGLKEGDILARNGHTEIFAYNKGGKHYVYNCGSDSSVNSPVPTTTGHKAGYTTVWRCGPAGTGVVTGTANVDGATASTDGSTTSSGGVSSITELLGGVATTFTNSIMKGLGFNVDESSSGTTTTTDGTSGDSGGTSNYTASVPDKLAGSSNAQKIWNYFKDQGLSNAGVAGLMGNMYQESGLNPMNLQGSYEKKLGYSDQSYTAAVDNGSYNNFVKDSAGYGLVQWTYHTLKKDLLEYKKKTGKSIGDLGMQLSFLSQQLQKDYPKIWKNLKNASSVPAATDEVMLNFERPADQSQAARNKRAGFGKSFYDKYAGGKGGNDGGRPISTAEQSLGGYGTGGYGTPKPEKVRTVSSSMEDSRSNPNTLSGRKYDSKSLTSDEASQLLKVMIDYLSQIADNTDTTNSELDKLNGKDFGVKNTTNNTVNNISNANTKSKTSKVDKTADRSSYEMAKRVAAGILV